MFYPITPTKTKKRQPVIYMIIYKLKDALDRCNLDICNGNCLGFALDRNDRCWANMFVPAWEIFNTKIAGKVKSRCRLVRCIKCLICSYPPDQRRAHLQDILRGIYTQPWLFMFQGKEKSRNRSRHFFADEQERQT